MVSSCSRFSLANIRRLLAEKRIAAEAPMPEDAPVIKVYSMSYFDSTDLQKSSIFAKL